MRQQVIFLFLEEIRVLSCSVCILNFIFVFLWGKTGVCRGTVFALLQPAPRKASWRLALPREAWDTTHCCEARKRARANLHSGLPWSLSRHPCFAIAEGWNSVCGRRLFPLPSSAFSGACVRRSEVESQGRHPACQHWLGLSFHQRRDGREVRTNALTVSGWLDAAERRIRKSRIKKTLFFELHADVWSN